MIEISNVVASAKNWVAGETATITFTMKNVSGFRFTKLLLYLVLRRSDFTGDTTGSDLHITLKRILGDEFLTPATVNIVNGASKTYTATFVIPSAVSEYFAANPGTRSVPIYVSYSETVHNLGGAYVLPDLKIINCRFVPAVKTFDLERATGTEKDDEGVNVLTDLKLGISETAFDYSKFFKAKIYYAEGTSADTGSSSLDITTRMGELLTGLTDSADLIPGEFSKESEWDFLIVFGDEHEAVEFHTSLLHSFANLHLSGQPTGGACFGGFSSSKKNRPMLESYYPAYFYKGISGVNIYSEEEANTGGLWIDRKPLYTKVLRRPYAISGTTHNIPTPEDAETLWIDPSASFCVNSNGGVYPVGYTNNSGVLAFAAAYYPGSKEIRAGSFTGDYADFYIKIFYTKTGDDKVYDV